MRAFLLLLPILLSLLPGPASGQAPPVLLRESFDGVLPPGLPAGWSSTQNRSPGINDFTSSTSTPRSTPNAVLSTNATIGQELHAPPLDFREMIPESVFFYIRRSSSHAARVVLEASTDGGVTFPFLIGDTLRGVSTTSYLPVRSAVPAQLAGSAAVNFRWRIIPEPAGTTGTLRLDDVSITGCFIRDLALRSVRLLPAHPREGDSIYVRAGITNAGRQSGPGFSLELFLDRDADSTADPAELLGSVAGISGLAPGDSTALTLAAGVLPAGRRGLIARIISASDQDTSNNTAFVPCPIGYAEASVVVNEIMYAPGGTEPEWVELANLRADTVDLVRWLVGDNTPGGRRTISAASRLIPPGAMVVLTRDSAGLRQIYPPMPPVIISVSGFPSLNNTGDAVVILDEQMFVIDSVAYLPSWGGAAGHSLERLDTGLEGNDPENWATTTDTLGGTPGSANSLVTLDDDLAVLRFRDQMASPGAPASVTLVTVNRGRRSEGIYAVRLFVDADGDSVADPGEQVAETVGCVSPARRDSASVIVTWDAPVSGTHLMIAVLDYAPDMRASNNTALASLRIAFAPASMIVNEIMADPVAGGTEYIEILNTSGAAVDLHGWTLRGTSGAATFPLGSARVGPGRFLVMAADSSLFRSFPRVREADGDCVTILNGSLGLNNDGDNVVIADPTGGAVDSVRYLGTWHNPGVDDVSGRSLERIRPLQGSNDPRNWSTSTDPAGGTPGAPNSIFTPVMPRASSMSVSPNPFSPDGDGREDFAVVQYHLPLQVSMIRARVFDLRGRLIRTIANNEPAGPNGELIWDGLDDGHRKARMGIYIILLEAMDDAGGAVETAKGTVVLAGNL
jgi:hypothetical protein